MLRWGRYTDCYKFTGTLISGTFHMSKNKPILASQEEYLAATSHRADSM
uniref:Uncharacterized protein n=1 Tax=Arundo donax TaxID=35708 RepID=A0A0A9GJ10_ARUDO